MQQNSIESRDTVSKVNSQTPQKTDYSLLLENYRFLILPSPIGIFTPTLILPPQGGGDEKRVHSRLKWGDLYFYISSNLNGFNYSLI